MVPSTALSWPVRERRSIRQHPVHDHGELAASATLAFCMPARLASFMAQLLRLAQPLTGLVRMTLAASPPSPIFEIRPLTSVSPD